MKEILSIIGLILELWAVFLLACQNINKITTLNNFPLTRSLIERFLAYSIGAIVTGGAIITLRYLKNSEFWSWIVWLLGLLVAAVWLPSIVIYARPYCRGIGPSNLEKAQQLNIRALFILAIGFASQGLGAVLKAS